MNFTRLRLAGFKTFVDPVDAPIEPGLTGIVGPNGCGKSNLVEAMRWVMGESSFKSLRASGMDDVIFAGSTSRPARNHAEVSLTLDNASGLAPSPYENASEIEVSRKISRGLGSSYRVNGREVRARDVQLLFADASSGARSPSMVGQGRVGEIINARPDQRRRILEEAAGIAGLHQRRREAESRLEGAEQNLSRVEDVIGQLSERAEALKKQARSAERYRVLSEEIGAAEGLSLLARHEADAAGLQAAESAETGALSAVAESTRRQGEAARMEAIASHALEPARLEAAEAEAALRRLALKTGELESEEARIRARLAELEIRIAQIEADVRREGALGDDAIAALARIDAALAGLNVETALPDDAADRAALAAADLAAAGAEAALAAEAHAQAIRSTERRDLARRQAEHAERAARLEREAGSLTAEAAALESEAARSGDATALGARVEAEKANLADADRAAEAAESAHAAARIDESRARGPAGEANARAERALAEARALAKLVADDPGRKFPPAVDLLLVDPGFEVALGAALGDDLDAALDARAPAHWAATEASADPALPAGVERLADHVTAPPELSRRLSQIGVVARADGPLLRASLQAGQRLVSREGDLWRWDGLTLGADAPTPAARRLAEKNRLGAVERAAAEACAERDRLRSAVEAARGRTAQAATAERVARDAARARRAALETAREAHVAAERAVARVAARLSAVAEARQRIAAQLEEANGAAGEASVRLAALPEPEAEKDLSELKTAVAEAREAAARRRAALDARAAEARRRAARLQELDAERLAWTTRREGAGARLDDLAQRKAEAEAERSGLAERPDELAAERLRLRTALTAAETAARAASDGLARAETAHREAERAARGALESLSATREEAARAGARLEAAREKASAAAARIMETRGVTPGELKATLAGVPHGTPEEVEARLARALSARERLGPVNLRAEQDLGEAQQAAAELAAEREDLTEAIARLRAAVRSLNSEGRGRLLSAFERVDANFRKLFEKLFEGGEARLELVESDDPLEAGLEVIARPPGKKPQTLSLLSGGEQALTALALVFAVFLTNPAPVCVLDEVDAPLDDANVERFCALLAEMASMTTTRFLTVTHNPITMAHMNRLIGVTMSERGVSQLVSVDLQTAERLAEAV
ncbi:chromosome segregation protein SMC [Methylopila sp. M107]|uniref:chromosome segregation protein SMC n=1 Tax=Methylopila sp. M107 TaxID=1101190 RepID=UPI00037B0374|nr:chromosome segregation protein SMC [Methylopila sp. M107]